MKKGMIMPDYIFESSWEVCNKVGGIYTVLSTRANTLQAELTDRIIFIGPDVWREKESPYFIEDKTLLADWKKQTAKEGLKVRIGRWDIPGKPISVLVDFLPYLRRRMTFTVGCGSSTRLIAFMRTATTTKPRCSLILLAWWLRAITNFILATRTM